MTSGIFVSCLGLVCPVGFTPESSAAALRAGISTFGELPYRDRDGEPVVGAMVTDLPATLTVRGRMVTLLTWAFESAIGRLPVPLAPADLPLLLCTRDAARIGAPLQGLVPAVEARLGMAFRRDASAAVAGGSVALFDALQRARTLLREGRAAACLVACVDSLIDARCLQWLEAGGRLKTAAQADGLTPGEAAAVLLVSLAPLTATGVRVDGLGFGLETATVSNDEPLLADGMAAAMRSALREAGVEMHDIAFRLADVAGESYAFEELSIAQTRVMRRTRETQDLWHPAASVGDCGAAAGALQLAWAEQAFARRYAPGDLALAQAGAFAGARAAAVLART